jgi:hypothetical protein
MPAEILPESGALSPPPEQLVTGGKSPIGMKRARKVSRKAGLRQQLFSFVAAGLKFTGFYRPSVGQTACLCIFEGALIRIGACALVLR